MKRIITLLLCLSLTASALSGCATEQAGSPSDGKVISLSDAVQVKAPVTFAPCDDFSAATRFGFELFSKVLDKEKENPVISPASAYLCLAMVMNGADGVTLSEFEKVMGGNLDAVNSLANALWNTIEDVQGNTICSVANSLWADDDRVSVQESFVERLVNYYNGEIYQVDLPSKEALDAINEWVNQNTNGLIPTLHDETYPEDTALVLLNTLYLKAKWQKMFEGYSTREKAFQKADGVEVTVPFMQAHTENEYYINIDGAEGVVLPYDDQKTAFVALRPNDGSSAKDFAKGLSAQRLRAYMDSAEDKIVNLSMPKFNLAFELYLTDVLKEMGLVSAFDGSKANFTPMGTGANGPLSLSYVFQKVKIEVNEEGTEAAAVTEAVARDSAAMLGEPIEIHFDSPFVYGVIDTQTGVPLFLGLLEDPSEQAK